MRVAIYATEPIFGGLNGFFKCGIYHIDSMSEADEIGRYLSNELIDSYDTLSQLYENQEREYDYAVYEIPDAFDDISDAVLRNNLYDCGFCDFIEKYSL